MTRLPVLSSLLSQSYWTRKSWINSWTIVRSCWTRHVPRKLQFIQARAHLRAHSRQVIHTLQRRLCARVSCDFIAPWSQLQPTTLSLWPTTFFRLSLFILLMLHFFFLFAFFLANRAKSLSRWIEVKRSALGPAPVLVHIRPTMIRFVKSIVLQFEGPRRSLNYQTGAKL